MMELVTIAKPYAHAVFDIAQQDKSHQDWRFVLEAATSIVADNQMQAYLSSPDVSKQNKQLMVKNLVVSVIGRALSTKENGFLSLVLDNGRALALPSILALFEKHLNTFEDTKKFSVISAYTLTTEEEENITTDLSTKYNATVSIGTTVDESLVGGLVIKLGDKVIDLSIKARADKLSLCLV